MKQPWNPRHIIIAILSALTLVLIVLFAYTLGRGAAQSAPAAEASAPAKAPAPAEVSAPAEEPSVSIPDLAQSVLYLEIYDGDGLLLGSASGFLFDEKTLVTNYHVIQDACYLSAFTPDLAAVVDFETLVAWDEDADLAILRSAHAPDAAILPLADSDAIRQGERIYAVGYPLGLANTLTEGIVSARYDMDGYQLLQITAPISQGNSGGAVLSESGEVVGVACMYLIDGQNLNYAIASNDVKRLYAEAEEEIPLADFYAEHAVKDDAPTSEPPQAEQPEPQAEQPQPQAEQPQPQPSKPQQPPPAQAPVEQAPVEQVPEPSPEPEIQAEPKYTLEQLQGTWSFYEQESETTLLTGKIIISGNSFYYEDFSSIGGYVRIITRSGTIDRLTESGFIAHITDAKWLENEEPWPQKTPWDWEIVIVSCDERRLVFYNPIENQTYYK